MFKNVAAQSIDVFALDYSTGGPKTGDASNIRVYLAKDDGTLTILGDTSAVEISSTNAPGWYRFSLTQAETNADKLLFTGKSSTSNLIIWAGGAIKTHTYTGPSDQRWVSDEFTIVLPKRSSGTTSAGPLRLTSAETVIAAVDFKNLLGIGDRVIAVTDATTTNMESITLTPTGPDRTLAKLRIEDFLPDVTYSIAVTVTTDLGDTLQGEFSMLTVS